MHATHAPSSNDCSTYLATAIQAAEAAGTVLRDYAKSGFRIDYKAAINLVTDADRQAEEQIVRTILSAYPSHRILAEERGQDGSTDSPYQWIIDPLDGTTNFLHGIPHFAISIAFRHKNRLEAALVYDPIRQEMFTASRGGSAQLNDRRMRVSGINSLENALLGTGFPFRHPRHRPAYLGMFGALFDKCAEIRRAGAASLDLAYVATGRLDAYWEIGLKAWDIAGGALLVQEAGGLVSDFGGGNDFMKTGNIVAGNPKVFKALLQEMQPHLTPELAR